MLFCTSNLESVHSHSLGRHEHGTIRAKFALEALKVLQDQTRGLYVLILMRASRFDTLHGMYVISMLYYQTYVYIYIELYIIAICSI